jgi:predicted MPP superfamily phosphohydrolase
MARGGVDVERVTLKVPSLHPAHDGLRVAQLSDIHVGPRTRPGTIRAAIEAVRRLEPDLVALTGDYVSRRKSEVGGVIDQLGGLPGPVLAVLGNHDHLVDANGTAAALRVHGYELIDNAWTTVRVRGEPLAVVGIGDLLTGNADVERAFRGAPEATPLVLAHGPRTADLLKRLDRPLACLSGHTHGGQVCLPFFTALAFGGFMNEPYLRGKFRVGKVSLYVNRGIGTHGGIRLGASPEVTLFELKAEG